MTNFFALSYYLTYYWISGHLEQYVMEIYNHLFDKIDETCRHQIIYNFIRAWYTRMYSIFMMQLVLNGTAYNDRFVDVDKVAAETSCPFYYQRLFKPSSRLGQE